MRVVPMSVATMLAAMVALTACATPNRLSDPAETEVLTFAEGSSGGQAVNKIWAEEVERASKGRIRIEFKYDWRAGEPQYEVGTVQDVQAGKVDMVGVGARVFDRIGYRGFQALLAPFLIDSYELEAKVFDKGIPDQMLAGMNQEGLVGLGILPGPMRRVVGLNGAFTNVKAFEGQQIAMNDSALTEETLTALGATARAWPAGGDLKGYDAVELQLSSVKGFGYAPVVDSIAANVNLWPRAGVLLISKARFDELSPEEQQILRTATATLRAGILEDLGAEDQEALTMLCKTDISFPVAKPADLRALEAAVSSVHKSLRTDPNTARWIDEIAGLKAAVAAPPEVASCDKSKQSSHAAGIPNGTYTRTITQADIDQLGITGPEGDTYRLGKWTLVFDNGLMTKINPNPDDVQTYTYSIFRDRIHAEGGETIEARFSYQDGKLLLTDMTFPDCDDCYNPDGSLRLGGDAVAFGVVPKPWVRQP